MDDAINAMSAARRVHHQTDAINAANGDTRKQPVVHAGSPGSNWVTGGPVDITPGPQQWERVPLQQPGEPLHVHLRAIAAWRREIAADAESDRRIEMDRAEADRQRRDSNIASALEYERAARILEAVKPIGSAGAFVTVDEVPEPAHIHGPECHRHRPGVPDEACCGPLAPESHWPPNPGYWNACPDPRTYAGTTERVATDTVNSWPDRDAVVDRA